MALRKAECSSFRDVLPRPRMLLILRLTLLLFLLHGGQSWHLSVPLQILCGIGLARPSLTARPALWLVLSAAMVWINALNWYWIDNHKYLMTYWCLACTLAVVGRDPERILAHNARLLVGLCFLFATAWKVGSLEYFDGSFMHHTLLSDPRLEAVAAALGGLEPSALADNREQFGLVSSFACEGLQAAFNTSADLRMISRILSYWTLMIESLVAWAFLAPRNSVIARARDYVLMLFIGSTYCVLPVVGFGCALAVLGVAQCDSGRRKVAGAYVALLVLMQLVSAPWETIVRGLL